uniref:Uncharacterized protein n=1 Tax=Meloidogyne enterolobii TaxID=390850 RepID=A0A6V7WX24_MELEN|nr:unnamed protein product [Meloidogyne enterolobii]
MASPSYTTSSNIPIPTYRSIGNKVIVPLENLQIIVYWCRLLLWLLLEFITVELMITIMEVEVVEIVLGVGRFTKTFMRGGSLSSASGMENSSGENNNRGGNVGYLLRDRPFTMISKIVC